jgi:hypothetical protein
MEQPLSAFLFPSFLNVWGLENLQNERAFAGSPSGSSIAQVLLLQGQIQYSLYIKERF